MPNTFIYWDVPKHQNIKNMINQFQFTQIFLSKYN